MSRVAIGFFILLICVLAFAEPDKPFWEKNPEELKSQLKDRNIPVSVTSTEISDGKHHLSMQGIGEVSAPFEYCHKWTANFNHLGRVGSFTREVNWNPISKILYLHTEAYGFHARMRIKVKQVDSKEKRDLQFEIMSGVFPGLKGSLKVLKSEFAKSRVSIETTYNYTQWNIPKLFLEFGLEVVLQKFAGRLRALIEEDFKAGRSPDPRLEKL